MILYMVVNDDGERYPHHNAHGRATYTSFANAKKARQRDIDYMESFLMRNNPDKKYTPPVIIKIDTMDGVVIDPESKG